nr:MAG TPA: hypothetical protein [Bacteriophage sp.]
MCRYTAKNSALNMTIIRCLPDQAPVCFGWSESGLT